VSEPKTTTEPQATPNGAEAKAQTGTPGDGDAAATVLADLEKLKARAAERDQFLELLQRTRADFENYQKRNQREREQERRFMYNQLFLDLLPVLDNLERATEAARKAGETGPLVQGVGLVQSQFLELLGRHGVKRIDAQGKPFDPNLHQALTQLPNAEHPPNTVIQVVENGYQMHDRILRPAKVVVSAPAAQ
jgi:molecular chaperone GrpE